MEREEGCGIAVVEAHCRYKAPARYDDELVVRTRITGARGSLVKFGYEIVRAEDGVVLCEGYTTHVVVGRDMRKMTMPERYAAAFRAAHVPVETA
jgi:acyl-CoA thioester hydrolase